MTPLSDGASIGPRSEEIDSGMSESGSHDIVIVSDLHLSAGYDPRTGAYKRNE